MASVEACIFEYLGDLKLLEGFKGYVFSPHGSRFDLLEGVDVDFLKIMGFFFVFQRLKLTSPCDDLAVNMLRTLFYGGLNGKQRVFGTENLFDPGAEFRPCFLGQVETRT